MRGWVLRVWVLGALCSSAQATNVGGTISTNTTWTLAGSPYVTTSTVTVTSNATLTIEPGVEVRFNANHGLVLGTSTAGKLVAQGTPAQPIRFTSNLASPAPGQWNGINFAVTTPASILDHCIVEYAGAGTNNTGVRCASSTPTIQNTTVQHSDGYGIFVTGSNVRPLLTGNTFASNGLHPLRLEIANYPTTFGGNVYTSNGVQAIQMLGGGVTSNLTLVNDGVPYHLTSTIQVNVNVVGTVTLTLVPGTVLAFAAATGIQVGDNLATEFGVLSAQGTSSQPIVFTSSSPSPAPGQWNGISFPVTTAASILSHCTVEYGGAGTNNANVRVSSSTPTIEDSLLSSSDAYGLYVTGANVRPTIRANTFTQNGGHPLRIEVSNLPTVLSDNVYGGNGTDAIEMLGGALLADTLLPLDGVPFTVTSDVFVNSNVVGTVRLTLLPGTTLRFASGAGLQIGDNLATELGELVAIGTPLLPITFTGVSAVPGSWDGVNLAVTTPNTVLERCTISHGGGSTFNAGLRIASSSPTIEHSSVLSSDGFGILATTSAPLLRSNTVSGNGTIGVSIGTGLATSLPAFENNTVTANGAEPLSLTISNYPVSMTGNVYTGNGSQQILLAGGAINTDVTLLDLGLPYAVTSTLSVNTITLGDVQLTVAPGVVLRFATGAGLVLGQAATERGILVARGTAAQPITFSSTAGTPGSWNGINFAATNGESILEHCIVEYGGGDTFNTNVRATSANPVVRNSTLRRSDGFGAVFTSTTQAIAVGNDVTENGLGGVSGTTADVRLIWWGDASGPSGGGTGSGQSVSAGSLYRPWLGAPRNPQFAFRSAAAVPETFTQNGGSTSLQALLDAPASWTISIRDGGGALVRSFTGTGAAVAQAWDGTDAAGVPLLDGLYTYAIDATSSAGGAIAAPVRGVLTLSSALPIAEITAPVSEAFVTGTFAVLGSAAGSNFASYRLEHGVGHAPTAWTTIVNTTTPVVDGTLANWNTAALTASVHTLRLTVTPTSGPAAVASVTVRRLALSTIVAAPAEISPNGDGIDETSLLTSLATYPVDWTLEVRDGVGALVRSFTGTGSAVQVVWDGRNAGGAVVPDALYTCQIQAVIVGGSTTASSTTTSVRVDATYPTAEITAPIEGAIVQGGGPLAIVGTASDANLLSWTLRRGVGASPSSFTTLVNTTVPVVAGQLYSQSFTGLAPGIYTYRLTVTDVAGNVTVLDRHITLDLMAVTNVSRSPEAIAAHSGDVATVNYTINHDGDVTLRFYSHPSLTLVRTMSFLDLVAGPQQANWDGRDDGGTLLPLGPYYFVITAVDDLGSQGTYNTATSPLAGATPVTTNATVDAVDFDPYENDVVTLEYDFSQLGRLTIQIRTTAGAAIRTLFTLATRTTGHHVEIWDGRNDAGQMYSGPFNVYWGAPVALPQNAIVLVGAPTDPTNFRTQAWLVHPLLREVSAIHYELPSPADVTIWVVDPNGNMVRTLVSDAPQSAGPQSIEWDGRNDAGEFVVLEGSYRVTVQALDSSSGASSSRTGSILVYR